MIDGQPVVLDTFSCQGGGGSGYARSGFKVFSVDLDHRAEKYNPYPFHHGDFFSVMSRLADGKEVEFRSNTGPLFLAAEDIDLRHGSPPCQGYTIGNAGKDTQWPKLIPDVREAFEALGGPYVIENVKGAETELKNPTPLCGCMFDLHTTDTDGVEIHLQRLRLFETNWGLVKPRECDHTNHEWVAGAYGGARRDKYEAKYIRKGGYVPPDKQVVQRLLGIEHDMTWAGLYECLPPAYTQYIGEQFLSL